MQVASHGENSGYEVPCLIVSAKDDLDPYPLAVQDSTRVFKLLISYMFVKLTLLVFLVLHAYLWYHNLFSSLASK